MDTIERPETDPHAPLERSRSLVQQLSESRIFKDYEKAFSQTTSLPLAIRPVESFQMAMRGKRNENPFCALMAKTSKSCITCLEMQANLERSSTNRPNSLQCFAGLYDTMVPIRIGDELVAYLETGQVLLDPPTPNGFENIARQLLDWGADIDLESLEKAYFQTRVLSREQHTGLVNMLSIFADHLAIVANWISIREYTKEPPTVKRARKYVEENFNRHVGLEEASKVMNTSVRYFCRIFKESTGLTFIEYLTRLRIEKSKELLLNSNKRVSEIAFEVGFESITQFNRSFRKLSRQTPTEYRNSAMSSYS